MKAYKLQKVTRYYKITRILKNIIRNMFGFNVSCPISFKNKYRSLAGLNQYGPQLYKKG